MDHPLYKLFSERVFIHYENGRIIKARDISDSALNNTIMQFKSSNDFQKILTMCLYQVATEKTSVDETVVLILNYITQNDRQVGLRYNHPLLHELSHQIACGSSFEVFKKIVSHPVYAGSVHSTSLFYIDKYGFTFKERLSVEMNSYSIKEHIDWININLNVKAHGKDIHVQGIGCLYRPTQEEYTFNQINKSVIE